MKERKSLCNKYWERKLFKEIKKKEYLISNMMGKKERKKERKKEERKKERKKSKSVKFWDRKYIWINKYAKNWVRKNEKKK